MIRFFKAFCLMSVLCCFPLGAEILTQWECKDPMPKGIQLRGKSAVRDAEGKKYLTAEAGCDFAGLFFSSKGGHGVTLTCTAMSLPDTVNASIGAVVLRYEDKKWKQVKNIGWNKILPFGKTKDIIFRLSADNIQGGLYLVILYRLSGKAAVEKILLEKTAADDPAFDATRKVVNIGISASEPRKYQYPEGQGDHQTLTYFPMGVFLYCGTVPDMETFEKSLAEIREAGANTVHYSGNIAPHAKKPWVNIATAAAAAKKNGLKLWVQMDDVYYRNDGHPLIRKVGVKNGMEFVQKYVGPRLDKYLPRYKEVSDVYAFSPAEENPPSSVKPLAEYRNHIWKILPEHRVYELFTVLETLQKIQPPWPNIAAVDRYPFMYSGRGASSRLWLPDSGLKWYAGAVRPFFNQAQKMGLPMVGVIQGTQIFAFYSAEDTVPGITNPEQLAAYKVPAAPGMRYFKKHNKFGRWAMYAPAENGIRAQAWTAVSEGAKGILVYAFSPIPYEKQLAAARESIEAGSRVKPVSLSSSNPQWADMKRTIAELKPWGKLFLSLEKIDKKPIDVKDTDLHCNSFRDPDGCEYAIVVNLRLTQKKPGLTPMIDEDGRLINLPPAEPKTFPLKSSQKLFDLSTGKQVSSVTLEPGQGTIILIGEKRSPEDIIEKYKEK